MPYRMGIGDLDAKLAAARERVERRAKLVRVRGAATADRERLAEQQSRHAAIVARERRDVDRLEGVSLTSLFYTLLGRRDDKLDEERKELLLAKLHGDVVTAELVAIDEQLAEIERQLDEVRGSEGELERLRKDKEQWLTHNGGPAADTLFNMAEESGRQRSLLRELGEARSQGARVLALLDEVIALLKSAAGWGTFDMLGGGLLATARKYSKIDDAKAKQEEAQAALRTFQRELTDVQIHMEAEMEISGFTRFADYFFEGLIFDWGVQSKINRSKDNVERTRDEVARAVEALREQHVTLAARIDDHSRQRDRFIEEWGR